MNDEIEMSLDSAQDSAAVEASENAAEGGEQSAGADVETAAEQDSADGQESSESENSGSDDVSGEGSDASDDEEFDDDYDEFYHDMSDFDEADLDGNFGEDDEDFEGGDTATDPEGEDGDNGENEGEESEGDPDEQTNDDENAEGEDNTSDDESGEGTDEGADDNAVADDQPEPSEDTGDSGAIDYASWEAQDRAAILKAHPELEGLLKGKHLSEVLDDPGLFGYMRGTAASRAKYSAVEAFEKASAKLLATRAANAKAKQSSKQHINSSNGKAANAGRSMPPEQRRIFRDMFPDLTPAQREELYNSVT